MDDNICNGNWRDEVSREFLYPLATTKQNRYSKMLKKFVKLLRIIFVARVKILAMESININNDLLKGK